MNKYIIIVLLLSISLNPISAQTKEEKKATKEEKALNEYQAMKDLINSKQYEFTGEWATSNSGNRVNLMSNPTSLKIDAESANAYFPFFGRGYSGSGYSGSGGIEFKDPLNDYTITYNDKKKTISVNFKAKGGNDKYDVTLKVFGSGSTTIVINSNNRSSMNYSGKIKPLKKEEK